MDLVAEDTRWEYETWARQLTCAIRCPQPHPWAGDTPGLGTSLGWGHLLWAVLR